MGIWSRALFTNFPEGRIDMSKFPENHPIRWYFGNISDDISLEEMMKLFHDHSKVWGYLTKQKMKAFENLFQEIVLQNPNHPKIIELHFFCIDENMPYYLGYHTEFEKGFYKLYHPNDVAFFTLGKVVDYYYRPTFQEDLYQKRYSNVFSSSQVYFSEAANEEDLY